MTANTAAISSVSGNTTAAITACDTTAAATNVSAIAASCSLAAAWFLGPGVWSHPKGTQGHRRP